MHCRTMNIDPRLTGQRIVMNVTSHMLSSNVFHITISCGGSYRNETFYPALRIPCAARRATGLCLP